MATLVSRDEDEKTEYLLSGVHAATCCPLDNEGRILEAILAQHVSCIAQTPGINGLLINGHAGEGNLLNVDERQLVLRTVRASVPSDCHVCAGVSGESTETAVLAATEAARHGANSILVFPPNAWALGHDKEMAVLHHKAIADACSLPIVLYRAPLAAGKQSYSIDTLKGLLAIDAVAAIKEGSWEVAAYEEVKRAIQLHRSDIAVLGSGDEHLMTCYAIGSAGSQVSLATIVPSLIVELFDAMQEGNLHKARECHALIYPLSEII